jgi:hypothetical protein
MSLDFISDIKFTSDVSLDFISDILILPDMSLKLILPLT